MHNFKRPEINEILEDIKSMLGTPDDINRTLSDLAINEDERLILQRAAMQIKKEKPNHEVIIRAHSIIIAKSFNNANANRHDDQNIINSIRKKEKLSFIQYIGYILPYTIMGVMIYLFIFNPFGKEQPKNEYIISREAHESMAIVFSQYEFDGSRVDKDEIPKLISKESDNTLPEEMKKKLREIMEIDKKRHQSSFERAVENTHAYADKVNESTRQINEAMEILAEQNKHSTDNTLRE